MRHRDIPMATKSFLLWLLILNSPLAFSVPGGSLPVAEEGPEKQTVTLEILRPAGPVRYRIPVVLRARFHNHGSQEAILCLDKPIYPNDTDRYVRWTTEAKQPVGIVFREAKQTGFVVPPHETLEIVLPPQLFFLGKHQVVASYADPQNGIPPLKSPAFELAVDNPPLTPEELAKIQEDIQTIIDGAIKSPAGCLRPGMRFPGQRKYCTGKLLIYSPYCVPQLQAALKMEDPQAVAAAIGILGLLADKAAAKQRGYIGDLSSAPALIDAVKRHQEPEIRQAGAAVLNRHYADLLTPKDKEFLQALALAEAKHAGQDAPRASPDKVKDFAEEIHLLWLGLPKSLAPLAKELSGSREQQRHVLRLVSGVLDHGAALGKKPAIGNDFCYELLFRIRKEKESDSRIAMMGLMGRLQPLVSPEVQQSMQEHLLHFLEDPQPEIRIQAATWLIELYPRKIPTVEARLKQPDFCSESDLETLQQALEKARPKTNPDGPR